MLKWTEVARHPPPLRRQLGLGALTSDRGIRSCKSRLLRYLVICQFAFLATVAISLLISSEGLRDNHGLSYYQHIGLFYPPFLIGMSTVAAFSLAGGNAVRGTSKRLELLKVAFYAFSVLIVAFLLTPDYVSSAFYSAHTFVSGSLFLCEFILAAWFTWASLRHKIDFLLFGVLLALGILALAADINRAHVLLLSETGFQITFFIILNRIVAIERFDDTLEVLICE